MKVTPQQMPEVLAALRNAVAAQIARWDAERDIETALGVEFDSMEPGIKDLAVSLDSGDEVTEEMVQEYIDRISDPDDEAEEESVG